MSGWLAAMSKRMIFRGCKVDSVLLQAARNMSKNGIISSFIGILGAMLKNYSAKILLTIDKIANFAKSFSTSYEI